MSETTSSIVHTVRGLSGSRRIAALGLVAVAVAGIWLLARWASAPTFITLYSDLDLREAAALNDHLEKAGVPHRLSGGGTEIQVPASEAARARVALAKEGLPSGGRPGLELFDKPSWGMTDFTQRVTYQRALEGELARTIAQIRGIERAQVHLHLPTTSPLRRLERPAGASVVLSLKAGGALAQEAVQGITYIVSNSVENLQSENVAVMDDTGHVLSVPSAAGSAEGMTTRQLEIQHSLEQHLAGKIEDLLATVVGSGRVRAQVGAKVNFDQKDRTVETYDPDGQVIQSEQRSETGEGGGEEGAGAGSQTVVNNTYLNSRRMERTTGSVGEIERLTVAVLVDEKALAESAGKGQPPIAPAQLEVMVRDAISADSTRGDRVSVLPVPMSPATLAAGGTGTPSDGVKTDPVQVAERVSRPLVNLVAVAALLFLVWRAFGFLGAARPAPGGAAGAGEPGALAQIQGGAEGGLVPLRHRLQGEVAERPEATAHVVRAWLGEENR